MKIFSQFDIMTALNSKLLRGGLFVVLLSTFAACFVMENKFTALAPGIWRSEERRVGKECW